MATHSCSCLENPRDRGAWYAAIYGVAQSWTQLKQLSSSSSSSSIYLNVFGIKYTGGSGVKNPPANAGDAGVIPWSRISPGDGNGNPLQYSCLENPMDGGTWQATIHGVTTNSWI